MAFTPNARWFRLEEVRNERYRGYHWERRLPKPLNGETREMYDKRWTELTKGSWIEEGIDTLYVLGKDDRVVHVGATRMIITILRQSKIWSRNGKMPEWDWVAISQGGNVEKRKFRLRVRFGFTRRLRNRQMDKDAMAFEVAEEVRERDAPARERASREAKEGLDARVKARLREEREALEKRDKAFEEFKKLNWEK